MRHYRKNHGPETCKLFAVFSQLRFSRTNFQQTVGTRLKPLIQKRSMTTQEIDAYLEELRNSEGICFLPFKVGCFRKA